MSDTEHGNMDGKAESPDAPESPVEREEREETATVTVTHGFSLSSAAVNLILPFVNGLMLGFGELAAHELAWRYNWFDRRNTAAFRVYPEQRKQQQEGKQVREQQAQLASVL